MNENDELTRLRAEVETLREEMEAQKVGAALLLDEMHASLRTLTDSNAAKADRLDRLGEQIAKLLREADERRAQHSEVNRKWVAYETAAKKQAERDRVALQEAGRIIEAERAISGVLRAEVEANKADAERYRWLRDGASAHSVDHIWHTYAPEERDAAIDAARAALKDRP